MFAYNHGQLDKYLQAFLTEEQAQKHPGLILSNLLLVSVFFMYITLNFWMIVILYRTALLSIYSLMQSAFFFYYITVNLKYKIHSVENRAFLLAKMRHVPTTYSKIYRYLPNASLSTDSKVLFRIAHPLSKVLLVMVYNGL